MKIGCVLLASGLAERFGKNKLLENFEGEPLIIRAFNALPVESFSDIVVVTAYDEIEKLAHTHGFRAIRNKHPKAGVGSTIKLGVASMAGTDACMICVCDQPYMSKNTLQAMTETYTGGIMAVSFDGKRGNPVIFPRSLYGKLLAINDNQSGRSVIHQHPDMLTLFPAKTEKELKDVDYLHDIDAF